MRFLPAVLLLALTTMPVVAQEGPSRDLGPWRVGAQVGVGAVLTPIGFVATGVATKRIAGALGASDSVASRAAGVGGSLGVVLGAASGAALVGARGPGRGSFGAAAAGGAAGALAGALVAYVGERVYDPADRPKPRCGVVCTLAGVSVVLLPSLGATIGYNLSR